MDSTGTTPHRRDPRWWLVGLSIICLSGLGLRLHFIRITSPYPLQQDEALIAKRAAEMVETGNLNPRFFRYPSFPIYLTAAALAAGHVLFPDENVPEGGNAVAEEHFIGRVGVPYYERPAVMHTARDLFASLSVLGLALTGLIGWRAFGRPELLVLVPLSLSASSLYLLQSWSYLNVDVVGTTVCTGAILYMVVTQARSSTFYRAVVPGLLTGLAVGSKYYLGLVGLPFALIILRSERSKRLKHGLLVSLWTVVGFVLSTPYSVLDPQLFGTQVFAEVEHYQSGHLGAEGARGLSQLGYYLAHTAGDFGPALTALGILGIAYGIKRSQWLTGLLLSFPLILLVFLSAQSVQFIRNALGIHAMFAVFIGLGSSQAWTLVRNALLRFTGRHRRRLAGTCAAALVLSAALALLPWKSIRDAYGVRRDSRTRAVAWIRTNVAAGTPVLVAEELQMDLRALEGDYGLIEAPMVDLVRSPFVSDRRSRVSSPVLVALQLDEGTRAASRYPILVGTLAHLQERVRFGKNNVSFRSTVPVYMGDPMLSIFEHPDPR
jgi:hypothetical protein